MGRKWGSHKKEQNLSNWSKSPITLREESTGKRETNISARSILKLQHIKNLATWASGKASIPSFGALFGHHLAASAESLGAPADPSLFTCQRCESILQSGSNCTIRIEKNKAKVQRRSKNSKLPLRNNVVYKCHFCSHRNLVRGTPRGHVKELYPPKTTALSKSEPANSTFPKSIISGRHDMGDGEVNKNGEAASGMSAVENVEVVSTDVLKDGPVTNSLATPLARVGTTLLEARSKKRSRSKSKKAAESESSSAVADAEKSVGASSKRRRQSWTSLKEKAESSNHVNRRNLTNLTIPFFI